MNSPEKSELFLEMLKHRLRRHLPPDAWNEFSALATEAIRFSRRELTVLHAESGVMPSERGLQSFTDELAWLTECHLGKLEPSSDGTAIVSFQAPHSALRVALGLHRMASNLRLRIGLSTGTCVVGLFKLQHELYAVALGPELGRAADLSRDASAGSVLLSCRTYEGLRDIIDTEVTGCILTEEFNGDQLAQACVTPIFRNSSGPSTFAGLGLM